MRRFTVDEPASLFPSARDAVVYLIGLGGFWGGIAAALVVTDAGVPAFAAGGFIVLALICGSLHMGTTRKLEARMSGRPVRPWPFGYPSFRTQVVATLPSTLMAAAQRLRFNAIILAGVMYSLLAIGLIALFDLPGRR